MPYYELTYGGHTWTRYRVFAKDRRALKLLEKQLEEGDGLPDEYIVKEDGSGFSIEDVCLSPDQEHPLPPLRVQG